MPRTLAQNAQYIAETIKPAIKSAIEAQGVTVPSTDSFLDYADRIGEIEGGGSGYQLKDLPTGSIATVNDAAPLPLNALKVSVEAVQDLHGYDKPWVGGAGKNKCDTSTNIVGLYDEYGTYIADTNYKTSVLIEISLNTAYSVSLFNTSTNTRVASLVITEWDANQNIIRQIANTDTFTTSANAKYVRIRNYGADTPLVQSGNYAYQLEVGSSPTDFAPYENICPIIGWDSGEITVCDDIQSPTQTKTYTLDFPQKIYGAEWDVVNGELKQTDGYIASYNGETLPSTWISDRDVYAIGATPTTGAEVVYKLATPATIDLSPLSIRMIQGVNNVYADCGDVIEGEYFVDEGAIDVRKVDYSIGSNSALKISDGRILQGFANMASYHSRPLDASGNWLDVDWSKSFEIGIAFKYTVADTNQTLFGSGIGNANYYKCPMIMLHPASQQFEIDISTTGNSWDITMSQTVTYASLTIDTWYFLKMTFNQNDMSLMIQISDDFSTWDTLLSITMSDAYYHDAASLCFGGFVQNSSFSSNNLLIDTFNTYIKGDGVSWGASTEAFPS